MVLPNTGPGRAATGVAPGSARPGSPPAGDKTVGGVHVRLARDEADLRAMVELGRVLHAESRYRGLPVDEARLLELGRRGLAERNPGLILAERDGRVVGMAVVLLGQHFFSPALAATVQLLYVHPEARGGASAVKLLRALRKWAKQAGAHDLHLNDTTGIAPGRTDRFLRRMGFRQTGGIMCWRGSGDESLEPR